MKLEQKIIPQAIILGKSSNNSILEKRHITTQLPAYIMGILNITKDSFWEQSRFLETQQAIEKALSMKEEGAHILDIGAESSRPGAQYISSHQEIESLIPIIEGIRKYSDIPISIDTRKKNVMEACWNVGADIVNDISALEDDPELGIFVSQKELPIILMHKRGNPEIMQSDTCYTHIIEQVKNYLQKRCQYAVSLGICHEKIIIDPGIGFGKDVAGNCSLIAHCKDFTQLGFPVLIGLSRKSFIGKITGQDTAQRLYGTLTAELLAVLYGATLLRVHDVQATVDMLTVLHAIIKNRSYNG